MISFDEAFAAVLTSAKSGLETEQVTLAKSLGRYLADDVKAGVAVPGFDNSAMDGYAVVSSSVTPGQSMPVSQRIPAGAEPSPLVEGTAARIFTGACVPPGADAVVAQEDASVDANGQVAFVETATAGKHIRRAGQDLPLGTMVASAGRRLSAADVGLIASVGIAQVRCARKIKIAFFSSGDELQVPGTPLKGTQIYNSNRYMLMACLQELGMETIDLGRCEDNALATRAKLLEASQQADVVLTTGGMSVGEEDYVRREAEAQGDLNFWKIAMKPGKPFAMGNIGGATFFGLPGNPVSTFVTFQLLVRPWLLKSTGADYLPKKVNATANFEFTNKGGRIDFIRIRLQSDSEGKLRAEAYDNQSSGVLSSIAFANALLPVPAKSAIKKGERVEVWLLGDFRV